MSPFTLSYLARLEVFGLGAAALQGALLYLCWRFWKRATEGAAPGLRHLLACAHFAALAISPILTLVILQSALAATSQPPAASLARGLQPLNPDDHGWGLLAANLTALWAIGALVMGLRLGLEALRVTRLKLDPAPENLVEAVQRLAHGWIAPQRTEVRLADVAAPQVIGLWRSTLLTPRDLGQQLSPTERDAVLLHELAHIRRCDFAWNLLQRMVLVLLWFQPAAWALYGELAREREVCCDALAVRQGASASGLARALLQLAGAKSASGLAMAVSSPGALTLRIHRLLRVHEAASPRRMRLGAALAVSAVCLLPVTTGALVAADPSLGELYNASAFGPTISINAHDTEGSFAIQVKEGRVVSASFGGKPIPSSRIRQIGGRATLVGAGQPPLALTITPQGRISWDART